MKIVLVQSAPQLNRKNLDLHIKTVKNFEKNCDVIVFPELSLSGYWLQDGVQDYAYSLDELEPLFKVSQNCAIVFGVAFKENGQFFNAAFYAKKDCLAHIHKKVHLPNKGLFEEARFYEPGNKIECFESSYKTVLLVCEDLWRQSTMDFLQKQKPKIVFVLAASPARGFENEELQILKKWYTFLETASCLTQSYVVFCNRVGFEDGLGFWGGSTVFCNGVQKVKLPVFEPVQEVMQLNFN